jgi:hypothetical protein
VAGTLLLHMSAEKSFWMLVAMLRRNGPYRLQSMFLRGTPQVIVSLHCLDRLIEMYLPKLFSHFKELKITPVLFANAWFTTLFGYTFPHSFTTVIWTLFFASGRVVLFRVAMGILKLSEEDLLKGDFEECLWTLKATSKLPVKAVLEEADRFATIDDRLVKMLKKEAIRLLKSSNVIDMM